MEWYFFIVLGLIAFLYASVGHGGASGYLAFMALIGSLPETMRSTALTLNLFVAGISFLGYYRGGYFRWKLIWPFVITSVPMAFIGARTHIHPEGYKIILAIFLLFAIFRLLVKPQKVKSGLPFNLPLALVIGAVLGFFSGLIGIGGGIILTPILIILGWASIKEAAAVSAPFILLNSASGLAGLWMGGFEVVADFWLWVLVALAGGTLGTYLGSRKMSNAGLHYLLAVVLAMAAVKLIFY